MRDDGYRGVRKGGAERRGEGKVETCQGWRRSEESEGRRRQGSEEKDADEGGTGEGEQCR